MRRPALALAVLVWAAALWSPCAAVTVHHAAFQFLHGPTHDGGVTPSHLAAVTGLLRVGSGAHGNGGPLSRITLRCGRLAYRTAGAAATGTVLEWRFGEHPHGTLAWWMPSAAAAAGTHGHVFVAVVDRRTRLLAAVSSATGCVLDLAHAATGASDGHHPGTHSHHVPVAFTTAVRCEEGGPAVADACNRHHAAMHAAVTAALHAAGRPVPPPPAAMAAAAAHADRLVDSGGTNATAAATATPPLLDMHRVFQGVDDADAVFSHSQDVKRKCVRHGHGGPVVGHVKVTDGQQATMSLLQVAHHLATGVRSGVMAEAGTIYETVIHPACNAFAYLTPRVTYLIGREMITDLLTNLMVETLKDPLTLPGIGALDPSAVETASGIAFLEGHATAQAEARAWATSRLATDTAAVARDTRGGGDTPPPKPQPPGLPGDLNSDIVDDVATTIVEGVAAKLPALLIPSASEAIVYDVTRLATTHTTEAVLTTLPTKLQHRLALQLTTLIHEKVTKTLLPLVSYGLTASLAHALSRDPKDDEYCRLCASTKTMYCAFCDHARTVDRVQDHVTELYTSYYSAYYSLFYTTTFASVATAEHFVHYKDPEPLWSGSGS